MSCHFSALLKIFLAVLFHLENKMWIQHTALCDPVQASVSKQPSHLTAAA